MDSLTSTAEQKLYPGEISALLNEIASLLIRVFLRTERARPQPDPESSFVRSQVLVAAIQAWLCGKVNLPGDPILHGALQSLESAISTAAVNLTWKQLANSRLLLGLARIFEQHSDSRVLFSVPKTRTVIRYTNFASIDKLRLPFFIRVGMLARGTNLRVALDDSGLGVAPT
jgi:hypothetical protein